MPIPEHFGIRTNLNDHVVVKVSAQVRRHDGGAAHGQQVIVASDDIADDRIEIDARHAGSRENDIRREPAVGHVECALCNGWCSTACRVQGAQSVAADEDFTVDLKFSIARRVDGYLTKVTIAVMKWANGDDVAAVYRAHFDQRAANANVLLINRLNLGDDDLL